MKKAKCQVCGKRATRRAWMGNYAVQVCDICCTKMTQHVKEHGRHQTMILLPIHDKYRERILRDGFKPLLLEIVSDVRSIWNKRQRLPLTFLSRMPEGIDYWEPTWDKSLVRGSSIALVQRNLVRHGLTEQLQVLETWDRADDGDEIVGESLSIIWQNRYDSAAWKCEIQGTSKRYLGPPVKVADFVNVNPIFWPWNTNEDVFEFWKISPEDQPALGAELDEAFASLR